MTEETVPMRRLSPDENRVTFALNERGPDDDSIHFFEENGFVVFRNAVAANERERLLDEIDKVFLKLTPDHEDVTAGEGPDGSPRAGRIYNLTKHSEFIKRLIEEDSRIDGISNLCPGAGSLMDTHRSGVLFQEKRPNPGSGFRGLKWHDDYDTPEYGRTLTVGIYFDQSSQANGAMRVVPGTHKRGRREDMPQNTDVHPDEIAVIANPGDMTAHINGLWHCSPIGWLNEGPESHRRVLYFTFSELEDLSGLPTEVPEDYRASVDLTT